MIWHEKANAQKVNASFSRQFTVKPKSTKMKTSFGVTTFILLLGVQCYAGVIPVGLRTENVIAWNVWENNNGVLTQEILLFNQTPGEIKVEIKLARFKPSGQKFDIIGNDTMAYSDTGFEEVATDTIFHTVALSSQQLVKLKYPEKLTDLDFMEYFENGERIGLIRITSVQPDKYFINNKYRYYSSESFNSGGVGAWVRLKSIKDTEPEIGITYSFQDKEDYWLVKILDDENDYPSYRDGLQGLKSANESIIKLTKARNISNFQFHGNQTDKKVLTIAIIMDGIINQGRVRGLLMIPVFIEG